MSFCKQFINPAFCFFFTHCVLLQSRPIPSHLTSAVAESILASACESESRNAAKRMRLDRQQVTFCRYLKLCMLLIGQHKDSCILTFLHFPSLPPLLCFPSFLSLPTLSILLSIFYSFFFPVHLFLHLFLPSFFSSFISICFLFSLHSFSSSPFFPLFFLFLFFFSSLPYLSSIPSFYPLFPFFHFIPSLFLLPYFPLLLLIFFRLPP